MAIVYLGDSLESHIPLTLIMFTVFLQGHSVTILRKSVRIIVSLHVEGIAIIFS